MVAATETRPWAARKARSAGVASRWIRLNARSPPRMTRPSRASPSTSARADEPTPAMAKTPSAMQAMNTPKPRTPPRSSRSASRSDSPRDGAANVADVTPSPRFHRLWHHAAKQKVRRNEEEERHQDHQADDPPASRHPLLRLDV